MTAEEFMREHAAKACSGRIPEIMADLTPAAMGQLGPLMAGGPNPPKENTVVPVSQNGDDYIFDVTYSGDGGATASMRETVRQIDGTWKIVELAKPA
ncbi:MAG: hypothetical protein WD359_03085 [Dehalococcoidia bacterium]